MSEKYLVVGCVTGYYGLQGWVKVKSFTQPADNIFSYSNCFISTGKNGSPNWQPAQITKGRPQGKSLVAKFADLDDRNAVEALGKFQIAVKLEDLPELAVDDFYWHQLEGLDVWSQEDGQEYLLGRIDHMLETGSNDVLVVKACEGSIDKRERLLPYRPEVVKKVDLASVRMDVEWDKDF